MARYKITCTIKEPSNAADKHKHIVKIGDGSRKWTIKEAYTAIDNKDEFYTHSASTGKEAKVEKFTCKTGHTFETLRSSHDAVADNNLDNLKACT